MAGQEYQCYISPYYEYNLPADFWASATAKVYHPVKYFNMTDTIEETLCVGLDDYIDSSCNHKTIAPTQTYIDSLADSVQLEMIGKTVGCNDCSDNYVAVVEEDTELGI